MYLVLDKLTFTQSINFNFLKTVTHSAKLIYKGPSIYKMKAKNLRKKEKKVQA